MQTVFVFSLEIKNRLTFCSFHRIEQNICVVGTSINKGCVYIKKSLVRTDTVFNDFVRQS